MYLYYNVCGGPWQWDGVASQQNLQCQNSSSIVDCSGRGTTPGPGTTPDPMSTMLY